MPSYIHGQKGVEEAKFFKKSSPYAMGKKKTIRFKLIPYIKSLKLSQQLIPYRLQIHKIGSRTNGLPQANTLPTNRMENLGSWVARDRAGRHNALTQLGLRGTQFWSSWAPVRRKMPLWANVAYFPGRPLKKENWAPPVMGKRKEKYQIVS